MQSLLDRHEPKQRHLAFLVGLLVLTFALTVMLAVKAHRSEVARQQQAQAVLHDLSGKVAQDWGRYLVEFGGSSILESFRGAVRTFRLDRDLDLAAVAEQTDTWRLCEACTSSMPKSFFSVAGDDIQLVGMTSAPAALLERLAVDLDSGRYSPVSDSVAIGFVLYDVAAGFAGAPVLIRFDGNGDVIRVVGYLVPPEVVGEFFSVPFDVLPFLPTSMAAHGGPNSTYFSIQVKRGPLTVFSTAADGSFSAEETVRHPLFEDLTLAVGIRDNAATRLLLDGAVTSGVPLLLTLLFAICGLIVLALVLVRREAELVRLRADFISGVSHELRTPLAQIRMFTETLLLNRVRSDVERKRSLEIIDQEARRLTHLVENVLTFSKSEGGRKPRLAPEPTDLAAEVRRAAESFGPMYRTRDVTLRTELQEGITVAVDRGALRQIMVNLLDNALKYGPQGQRLTVGAALFDDQTRVWVDDEGPGVPEGERERVFESFFRLPRDAKSRSSGSGIGLAVVRELAQLHGGDAWVTSAPGGGARVVVQFPDAYLRTESAAEFAAAS
jgi:signal transduction histidine kinase